MEGQVESSERSWLLRPGRERVEGWLGNWWRRWAVLVGIPCIMVRVFLLRKKTGGSNEVQVWLWCSIPFPVSDPYVEAPPWNLPWPSEPPQRAVSANYGGFGGVGIWMAEGVAGLIGLGEEKGERKVRRDQVLLEFVESAAVQESTNATAGAAVKEKPTDPDPDLPVDANFYFFLFVCESWVSPLLAPS